MKETQSKRKEPSQLCDDCHRQHGESYPQPQLYLCQTCHHDRVVIARRRASSITSRGVSAIKSVPVLRVIPSNDEKLDEAGQKEEKEKALIASDTSSSSSTASGRGNWIGRMDFLLSCIGYAVGLGNIWRFPYLVYRNGGAVFLIPYIIFLVIIGMPLFFMEVSYGQFASLSPITVWRMSPLFKGIGYGMVIISGIVCIYYNIIITWTLYYLFKSFNSVLPWSTCNNPWNTPACRGGANITYNATLATGTINTTMVNFTRMRTPSEEFWENNVLQISSGIEDIGGIRLELMGCLALAWVVIFLCLCKGVQSSGRVVYVTATFPYLVLIILLIRGVTLPGSMQGIKFYLVPQWSKLLDLKVWGEAAMQIFYSVGAAWGALITMSSYNRFKNNCYRDAIIVPILNCGTSIFAGFVIFSIIGFMAHETNSDVADVVTMGPGLVFVVYPEAVSRMFFAPLWAVLFFLMLFTIGLDSQFGMFETMTSAMFDEFPQLFRKKKLLLTASLCVVEFLLGLPCITNGGVYILQIMDWYSSTFSLMIISFTELVVISWIYGVQRFTRDIELMVGHQPSLWWRTMWSFVTPAMIMCIFLYSVSSHKPVTYGDDGGYKYPGWAVGVGWALALCSIIPLPLVALVKLLTGSKGTLLERLKFQSQPTENWGPALPEDFKDYQSSLLRHRTNLVQPKEQGTQAERVHLDEVEPTEEKTSPV